MVNAILRRLSALESLAEHLEVAMPAWLYQDFRLALGEPTARQSAQAMLQAAPLWVTSFHPESRPSLLAEGCRVEAGPLEGTLALRCHQALPRSSAFQRGWIQPQNPSSALPARLLDPRPGDRILDLAGGNGIKAAQLCAAGAEVISVDNDAGSLARAERNLARLGLRATQRLADLSDPPPALEAAVKVLLDAPCSGSGTLRNHPEIKMRLSKQDLARLVDRQRRLLETAAGLTRPGGLLVYAVCSLTREEGHDQIEAFLASHRDFMPQPFPTEFPNKDTGLGSYLLPLAGLDGFFVSRLRRR